MTTKVVPGMLVALQSSEDAAREAATRIARTMREGIKARGKIAIALSGGETPKAAYARLAKEPDIDWSCVDVFWVDERAVPPTDNRSNYRWAKEMLVDNVTIPADQVHRMPADAPDLEQAAKEYAQLIAARVLPGDKGVPAFDVLVMGVGDDGHTASLFPGTPTIDIVDRTVAAVPSSVSKLEARLTLTVPILEQARMAFVLAVGAKKTAALERVWSSSGSNKETPARILRGVRGTVVWIIDKAAGGIS